MSSPQKSVTETCRLELDFSRIALSHRPIIFRFLAASLKDADLAETLTQECFLRACRHWASFRGHSTPATWLMRIAVNLRKDHWRDRRAQFWRQATKNSVDLDLACDWLASAESPLDERIDAGRRVAGLWKVMNCLSAREKEVFGLRFVEEMKIREISSHTGLKQGAVKVYLARSLRKVRSELQSRP